MRYQQGVERGAVGKNNGIGLDLVKNLTGKAVGPGVTGFPGFQEIGVIVAVRDMAVIFENPLPIKNKIIYYKYFSKINTKEIISNNKIKNKINSSGIKALKKIKTLKNINLKNIIKTSKEFSVNSGLLKNKKVVETIDEIEKNGGNASMIMLGNAVFSDKKFRGSKELIIKDKGAE